MDEILEAYIRGTEVWPEASRLAWWIVKDRKHANPRKMLPGDEALTDL